MVSNLIKIKIANWLLNPDNPSELPLKKAEEQIKRLGLEKVYYDIELPLIDILENMRKIGIAVDEKVLGKLLKKYNRQIKTLEKKIYKVAGEEFNINSPKQLSRILFKKLKLGELLLNGTAVKNKSNFQSTRAEKLLELRGRHPIIDLVLRYREAFKVKSTYLEPLDSRLPAGQAGLPTGQAGLPTGQAGLPTGQAGLPAGRQGLHESAGKNRIHTTLLQTGTATGRFSSRNPNLQNIPAAVKQVFVAGKGFQLVSFDYSQVELRILATLSQDPKMLKAFSEGKDIHAITASQVFNVSVGEVDAKMRHLAKTLNFGIAYGMGATAFSKASGLSVKEARHFINEYFSDFERIKKWQEEIKQEARKNGYVENLNGRKRWLPAINSVNQFLVAEAERAAINMPVQSLAADIIKLAMIKTHKKAKLLLSIHDELLFEIKNDRVKESIKQIRDIMETVYSLDGVELKVDVKAGRRWSDLKKIIKI